MALTRTAVPDVPRAKSGRQADPELVEALKILAAEVAESDTGRSETAFTTDPAKYTGDDDVKRAANVVRSNALVAGISATVIATVDEKKGTYVLTFWGVPRRTKRRKAATDQDATD